MITGLSPSKVIESSDRLIIGVLSSIATEFGDLLESAIKRKVGLKDMGKIMPGHGGWFDRFDAVLTAAPVAIIYLIIFMHNM